MPALEPARPRARGYARTSTLGVKAAPAAALHKAAQLLGGRPERRTGGHNYVAYRLPPAGLTVLLPAGAGEVGRSHLRDTVQGFLRAGVPPLLLVHALDAAGVSWHARPARAPRVARVLRRHAELARAGAWGELLALARAGRRGRGADAD